VGVDVLFFRHHVWERLIANVGIVLVFAALYLSGLLRKFAHVFVTAQAARLRVGLRSSSRLSRRSRSERVKVHSKGLAICS
jgi:hypothetical protein